MDRRLRSFLDPDFLLDSPILSSPLLALRQIQEEFGRYLEGQPSATGDSAFPPVNLWVGAEGGVAYVEAAGINPQTLDLSVRGTTLTLKGERPAPELQGEERWVRRERPVGAFARVIDLPFAVNSEKVEAEYKNGVVKITLPRAEVDKPRRIAVRH